MKTIEIRDMEVKIDISKSITSIIGPTNSGKTIIAKRLCNRIDNSAVYIDGKAISEYDFDFLRRNIVVVLDDDNYKRETVFEELYVYLGILNLKVDEVSKRIDELAKYFKIKKLMDMKISDLYLEDKILIKILSLLIINPKVIVIDNLISYLEPQKSDLLFKYIKQNKISLINITTNPEHLVISDNIIVLNNFKRVISGDYISILDGNSILPYMGLKLPFAVDLSNNLILYNVVDKITYDYRKLVSKLWK